MIIVERNSKTESELKHGLSTRFLYNTLFGRLILKSLTNKFFANTGAFFMKSRFSKPMAMRKIKANKIDMNLYQNSKYKSYNDFFTRKLKTINVDFNKNSFISPCDSKLMILKLNDESTFKVKNSIYDMKEIINNDCIYDFEDGYALIFRLDVNDYHHYLYIDDGTREDFHFIKGALHTVQPIVYDKVKVFHRNSREWCLLHTKNFNDVIYVEVGALLVGKIQNDKTIKTFKKGDEKGYFEFGGSTIILFVKKNTVKFDDDILENSKLGKETIVKCGEKIGQSIK